MTIDELESLDQLFLKLNFRTYFGYCYENDDFLIKFEFFNSFVTKVSFENKKFKLKNKSVINFPTIEKIMFSIQNLKYSKFEEFYNENINL
ncbi:MAG: hypothetical protein ABIP51_17865 [Bacteroidia bacterium]